MAKEEAGASILTKEQEAEYMVSRAQRSVKEKARLIRAKVEEQIAYIMSLEHLSEEHLLLRMPAETEKLGEMLERIRRLGSAKSSKELRNLVLAVGTAVADMRTKMTQMESKDRELDRLRDDVIASGS